MIRAIKGGCDTRHPRTFLLTRPNGLPNHVVLIIRSAGEFQIGSEHFTVTPSQAVILAPHTSYRYGNPDGIYMDDWLHFETTDEACTRRLNAMSNLLHPADPLGTILRRPCRRAGEYGRAVRSPSQSPERSLSQASRPAGAQSFSGASAAAPAGDGKHKSGTAYRR